MLDLDHKPDFFIVGAPKCGTTSLYRWLKQHPGIFMPEKKEPMFFCEDIRKKSQQNSSERFFDIWSQNEYLKLFADADNQKAVGEASTWYLYSDVAAENIYQFNPKAKIIIMLRDPVEQIISSYNYGVSKGDETVSSLQKALKLESARKKDPPEGQFPGSYLYTDVANYAPQIKRYQKLFADKQIEVLLLDDLKNNPKKVYQDALTFLEIDNTDFAPDFSADNTGKTPRFRWLNKALKHPQSPIRKVAEYLPKDITKQVRSWIDHLLLYSQKPDISQAVRKQLHKEMKPSVEKTSDLIDKNLVSLWGY